MITLLKKNYALIRSYVVIFLFGISSSFLFFFFLFFKKKRRYFSSEKLSKKEKKKKYHTGLENNFNQMVI
jgi:hypothetical protein